ncbi:MAG: NAD(P)-binding domain-containing protein, partial [Brachybacterium sp.]|nr:NAD(P)-binding domain-containing protein [Brachybacterium sp.]
PSRTPRLGVLGPGKIGSALARTALRSGLEVQVTGRTSRPALAARLPGARPVGVTALAASSDIVAITVPLHVALALDPGALREVIVIDATNPWGAADAAALAEARTALGDLDATLSTSELLAARIPQARVVKTLNHIGYHDLEDRGREDGHPHRRAIAVAADDPRAADAVGALLQRLGYDPVAVGTLADGRELEPGAALFGTWSTAEELSRRQEQILAV